MNSSYTPLVAILAVGLGAAFLISKQDDDKTSLEQSVATQGSAQVTTDQSAAPAQPAAAASGANATSAAQPSEEVGLIEEAWSEVKEFGRDAMDAMTGEDDNAQAQSPQKRYLPLGFGSSQVEQSGQAQPTAAARSASATSTSQSSEEEGLIEEVWSEVKEFGRDAMDAVTGDDENASAQTTTDQNAAQAQSPQKRYLPLGFGSSQVEQSGQAQPTAAARSASEEESLIEEAWSEVKELGREAMDAVTGDDENASAQTTTDQDAAQAQQPAPTASGMDATSASHDKDAGPAQPATYKDAAQAYPGAYNNPTQSQPATAPSGANATSDSQPGDDKQTGAQEAKTDSANMPQDEHSVSHRVEEVWEEIKEAGEEAAEIFTGEDATEKAQSQ